MLARVDDIHFEWSPGRGDPRCLAHRSAFDVAVLGRDSALRELPLRQVRFDHLLALSMVGDGAGRGGRARFVLLAPAINVAAAAVDAACRRRLNDALTYERRTLEEVVAVIASATDDARIDDFSGRYLAASGRDGAGRTVPG